MITGFVLCVVGLLLLGAALSRPIDQSQKLAIAALGLSSGSAGAAYLVVGSRQPPDILLLAAVGLGLVAVGETCYLMSAEWARFSGRYRRTRRLMRLLLYGLDASLFGLLMSVVFGIMLHGNPTTPASYAAMASIMGLVVAVPPLAQSGVANVQAPRTTVVLLAATAFGLIAYWLDGIDAFQTSCLVGTLLLLGLAYRGATNTSADPDQIADARYAVLQVVLSSSVITLVFAALAVRLLLLRA